MNSIKNRAHKVSKLLSYIIYTRLNSAIKWNGFTINETVATLVTLRKSML